MNRRNRDASVATGRTSGIPAFRKKLIEVALPLETINRGCVDDKNRKTGHIRNLHKWFAPMPLPAWRAMLFATLIDDPGEHLQYPEAALERERLFRLIERLSSFDAYKDAGLLDDVRAEIARATSPTVPTVVDPFCGGGSTVLEAQRLGLPTLASDLNPVPVVITTVLCRVPALFGNRSPVNPLANKKLLEGNSGIEGFKTDVTLYARRVCDLARARLAFLYPDIDGATPFAYRWAWSVVSPDPAAGGRRTPLVSNWDLSRHKKAPAHVQPVVQEGVIDFQIRTRDRAPAPTVGRAGAIDLWSSAAIPLEYIREQGRAGKLSQTLIAIAARDGAQIRWVAPTASQTLLAANVPEVDLPGIALPEAALGFRVQQYGIKDFLGLFTRRQAFALKTFADLVAVVHDEIVSCAVEEGFTDDGKSLESGGKGATAYADAVTAVLALCVGKMAQSNNILVRWFIDPRNGSGKATPAFDRHAVPMVWDFVETNPFGNSVGDWLGPVLETALRAFDLTVSDTQPAIVSQADARTVATQLSGSSLIATDPPYYANIGYADLSDFFYLWLRLALKPSFPSLFSTVATPKDNELIATPYRHGGNIERANAYFRRGFAEVIGGHAEMADTRFPMLIVYAIKQSEEGDEAVHSTGWEVFLDGLIASGVAVVATWPVRTTAVTRMIGLGTNALASAIFVLVRKRDGNATTATRREFVAALRAELPAALLHLQQCNIAPVDLAQAAIGPGMAVYTRYAKVLDAEGEPVPVREALALINQVLDETLVEQEVDFDADSCFALAWFEQHGFEEGQFGVAETLSKAKNTSISGLAVAGLLESKRGRVRLFKPFELPGDWDPATAARFTHWETVHHLIRVLGAGGERAVAEMVVKLGTKADTARELAYRLYTVCERKKRATEALSYNALVQSWPEVMRLAREDGKSKAEQASLFAETEG
jgi:putative DNA methylase